MKIGVFGDSFAEKNYAGTGLIWYDILQKDHGHQVECFGESGSSILFSAELIHKTAQLYDLVIWCLTTPGRFSLPNMINGRRVHVTTSQDQCVAKDLEIAKKHSVCVDYLKYVFEWETENLIGRALASYLQTTHGNVMILPCFPPPLSSQFNLYTLCENEAQHYFPGQSIPKIYQEYQDVRPGHITQENQAILAGLINQNLVPGIFQTSYDNFVAPVKPFDQAFKKL